MEPKPDKEPIELAVRPCPMCFSTEYTVGTDGIKDYVACLKCNFPVGELVPFEKEGVYVSPLLHCTRYSLEDNAHDHT